MSEIDGLLHAYEQLVRLLWPKVLSGPEKVWFAIYEQSQERRLRLRLPDFAVATKNAGHSWILLDLSDAFAHWMAQQEYREAYFEQPEDMALLLPRFRDYLIELVKTRLCAPEADENSVVAVLGVASLFGLAYTSEVIEGASTAIRGRLLVFFPGQHEGANYRLMDARDGWNYLAVPIKASAGK